MTGPAGRPGAGAPAEDAVRTVYVAVRDAVVDLGPADLVLVGCSGGPDSLAVAAAAARLRSRGGPRAGAVVVDHGWSPASSVAAADAGRACRTLGLDPVDVVAVDCSGPGGPEAAARDARYAAFERAAAVTGARAVLLGHTRNDQAETVLLGLARGSGARSLAGMPARRGLYRRPLLGVDRVVPAAACAQLDLVPWHDPANEDAAFARVRVRALTGALEEALGPGVIPALARSADLLRDDADALDELGARLLDEALVAGAGTRVSAAGVSRDDGGDEVTLDVPTLAAAPAAVRRRALLAAARRAGSPAGAVGSRHALALDALLVPGGSPRGPVHLPGRVMAALDCGRLRFAAARVG